MKKLLRLVGVSIFSSLLMIACGGGGGGTGSGASVPLISNVSIVGDSDRIALSWTTNAELDELAVIWSNATEFDLTAIESINLTDIQNNELGLQSVIDEVKRDNLGVSINSRELDADATSTSFSLQELGGRIGEYSFAFVAVHQNILRWHSDIYTAELLPAAEDNNDIIDNDDMPTVIGDTDRDGHNDDVDNCPLLYDLLNLADCGVDVDHDGYANAEDVDDDNDSLIEVWTPEEFDAMRHVLNGSGRFVAVGAKPDQQGCPETGCTGYELMRDISLAGLNYGTVGWQPIGHDTDSTEGVQGICDGGAFTAIFEGNGLVISDLSINRPYQDCVGLFGHVGDGGEIRNVTVEVGDVYGRFSVGGLVGYGDNAEILSTSVIVDLLDANYSIGGLMGEGLNTPVIRSHAIVDILRGDEDMGGLVGTGIDSDIFSSYAIVSLLTGEDDIGGLIGAGDSSDIYSSYVVADTLNGTIDIGGLVGDGQNSNIYASYAIANSLNGETGAAGGLMGTATGDLNIEGSYAVFGSLTGVNMGALIGLPPLAPSVTSVVFSYWDTNTSDLETSNYGTPQTTQALVSPRDYAEPYNVWRDPAVVVESIVVTQGLNNPTAIWCDQNYDAVLDSAEEQVDNNRIWNFGSKKEYPAIRCTSDTLEDQRTWWYLNETGQPTLNRTKLGDFIQ